MSDQDYENLQSAIQNNNADNTNLQPMGVYEAAATPVQQRPESAPKIAKLTAEDYASIIEAPLTGEEVALKIAKLNEAGIDIDSNTINIEEFKAYDEWRKKQHFDFWGAIGDGLAQTGKDLGKGVVSAATDWKKLALATGLSAVATPAVGFSVAYGMTGLEGFWRGTRDLGGLFVMAANHPSSPLYRMFINPSGDVNQSYQDFLDLSKWNAQSEKIISGKTNALMPDRETYEKLFGKAFGGQVDDFIGVNKELATAASYVLDPTVFFTFGASSASKAGAKAITNKAAAAALKSGQANGHLAGSVAARAARNTMKATYLNSLGSGMVKFSQAITEPLEKGYGWLTKNIERITGGAHITATGQTRYRRFSPSSGHGPSSFTHATMGALGAYSLFSIPYAVPIASVYGGLKAIGYAGEALAAAGTKKTLTAGAATVAKGLEMSTPVALYFKDLAKTTVHGSVYGGLIGGFAGGEEGAAGGIGTGMALGAIGHNVALVSGTISGKFAKMDQIKKFEDAVKVFEEKGHILKAKNMKKFVEDIRLSYGDDEAVRAMGHLLGLEGGKNATIAYFTPEDMKNAWMSDPDYWTEIDDGNGGKKKVLTELGEEIKRNADRGGRAWNGLFMEIDPKTGKSIETPILQYKDKKSGRYHVVINTEAMKFSRNPDGTLRYRTVTEMVKTRVERTRDKGTRTESYQYDETVEGPRPRGAWDDPTVPRDGTARPETTAETTPDTAATENVNTEGGFTAPAPVRRKRMIKPDGTEGNVALSSDSRVRNMARYLFTEFGSAINSAGGIDGLRINERTKQRLAGFEKLTAEEQQKVKDLVADHLLELEIETEKVKQENQQTSRETKAINDKFASFVDGKLKEGMSFEDIQKLPEYEKLKKESKEATDKQNKGGRNAQKELNRKIEMDINSNEDVAEILEASPEDREKLFNELVDRDYKPEEYRKILEKKLKEQGIMSESGRFKTTTKSKLQVIDRDGNDIGLTSAQADTAKKIGELQNKEATARKNFKNKAKAEAEAKAKKKADAETKEKPKSEKAQRDSLSDKEVSDVHRLVSYTRKEGASRNRFFNAYKEWVKYGRKDLSYDKDILSHMKAYDKLSDSQKKYFETLVEGYYDESDKISANNLSKLTGIGHIYALLSGGNPQKDVNHNFRLFFGMINGNDVTDYSVQRTFNEGTVKENVKRSRDRLNEQMQIVKEKGLYEGLDADVKAKWEQIAKEEGYTDVKTEAPKAEAEAPKVEFDEAKADKDFEATDEYKQIQSEIQKEKENLAKQTATAKPTETARPATAPATGRKDIPARKQRGRSVELQGPGRPLTIRRTGERQVPLGTEKYFEDVEGPVTRQEPIFERVNSQALSELYHIMNRVRRRVEHGTEIDGVIRNWLFGDKEGVYSGAFNRDRKKITEFMVQAYNMIVGPRAGSQTAVEWKKTIEEYEKTGKITEATSEAFETFIEEVGESLFIGWESGKPFDFILKGGDLGTVRNFVEALKDTWANHIERTAVNLGADINTKQAFFDWFKKNKAGGKFRFDPYIEQAFTDLVRVYADKGMKNNGRSYANVYTMPPAAVKDHIEQYQLEEYVTKDKDGNFKLKPLDQVHRERHEAGLKMADELAELAQNDPAALNGLDFIVFDDYYGVESPKIEGGIAEGLDALDKDSKSAFDPNTLQSKDTMAFRGGVLFSSGDMADVGPSLDDIVKAQVARSRKDGIYKDRGFETFGARGRPRTTPTAKMALTMKQALARGKTLVFRGIPTEKAFAIIEKYVPKSVSKNVRAIAPVIADGGHTSSNVMRSTYLGFEQSQADGTILYREMGHQFNAREVNYVPYDMEFRITLRNPKNPQVNYKQPHFAFLTRIFDMDALNNRTHRLWNESPELRNAYNNIDEFITDVHSTIDEYSGSGMIPAVKFFGADEYAREKRMFVMAAIGASPSNRVKTEYGHSVYTVAEADWHELQHKNKMGANMHPWKSLRLDNMRDIASIPDESMHVRVSQQQYRRSQVPTPTTDESSLYDASYSAPDGPIELIVENLRDYHESSGTGEYNHVNVIKGLNDPLKLVKRLKKAPESDFETPKVMFNSADTFGGVTPDEIEFLKSNYQWAVSQGDIFLAESMIRFMNQFGKDAILIRHTLEEHLNAGGTIQEYNKEVKTGVPVVFPVQHGTGSEAFLRDPVFKPEFLGKTTHADSARMGYFFAGLQETAASYARMAKADKSPKQKSIDMLKFLATNMGWILQKDMVNGKLSNKAQIRLTEFKSELKNAGIDEATAKEVIDRIETTAKLAGESKQRFSEELKASLPIIDKIIKEEVSTDNYKLMRGLALLNGLLSGLDDSEINVEHYIGSFNRSMGYAIADIANAYNNMQLFIGENPNKLETPEEKVDNWILNNQKLIDDKLKEQGLTTDDTEIKDTVTWIGSNKSFTGIVKEAIESPLAQAGVEIEQAIRRALIDSHKFIELSDAKVEMDNRTETVSKVARLEIGRLFKERIKMMRSFVGFKNPYVYDFKGQGRSAGPRFGQIYKTAIENGHDGIILQNIHDRGPNDNIVSVVKGKENHIAVTDTSLSDAPAPRNSGYVEGGRYLASAGDVLPEGAFGPNNPETVVLSRSFKESRGFNSDEGDFIVKLNIDKSFKVGMAYEQMKHDPFNPKVREAYQQFAKETLEQFQHILEAGYRPQMHQFETEPYSSSRQAISSLRETKTLKVLSTDLNFGQRRVTEADIRENPLLAMTKYKDINGVPMRVNDVFRFVHDFFGHSERGNSFGPLGEENAWDVHARMYSPLARRAMTAGTRGQNSWVNFVHGENIEINRKRDMARRLEREGRIAEAAEIRNTIPKTTFAQQKIGLLPEWASKFDDQLTPIEREIYGTHQVRKTSKGSFSAGDSAEHVWSPDPEEFAIRGAEARASSKFGTSVEIKNPEDYRGYELFMIGEGRAMASVSPDGELGSVLKGISGTSDDVVRVIEAALASGKVRWLNAFDTVLPSMYQKYGFEAVARLKFVDEYRPDGWDYELYNKFNGGRPDVVFMAYVGPEATSYKFFKGVEVATYDEAVALTHARVEEGKGMFSAGDIADFNDYTDQTKDNIELVRLVPEYADKVRILNKKVELGELTQAQMNFQLNKWHKDNNTGNTAKSWETFNVGGEKVNIADMTTLKVEELIAEVKTRDPNYKKFLARAMKAEADRAIAEAKAVEEQLQAEIDANNQASGTETGLDVWRRIRRTKTLQSGLTMLQRVREWNDQIDADQSESIARALDKDYDKRRSREESDMKRMEKLAKLRERRVDKILLRYAKENEAARLAGEEIPYVGDDDVLRKMADNEAQQEELFGDFDEDLIQAELDASKMSKEDRESILRETERATRGSIDVVRNEDGTTEAIYDQSIDDDLYEKLLAEGLDEKKAWKQARKSFLSQKHADDLKPITLEEAIAQVKADVEKHAKENDGEVLYTPEQIEEEAQFIVKVRQQIIDAANGIKEAEPISGVRKGTYEYMAKVQFANTEYYDAEGNTIMWKGEKTGKIYRGLKARKKTEKGTKTKKVTIGGEVVDESVAPVYPPEQEAMINEINNNLRAFLNGTSVARDKALVFLDFYRLWGYEVNENLSDKTFVPRRSIVREQGLSGQALTREIMASRGDFITAYDVEAVFTERLDAMPDLFNTIHELLSDIYMGAEYGKEQALQIWIEGMTKKGRRPTDAQIAEMKEKFKDIDSDIEIDKVIVEKFIREFMAEGNYALSAEDLITSSKQDPEGYIKQNRANKIKAGRDRLRRKIANEEGVERNITDEERKAVDAESMKELEAEAREATEEKLSFPAKFLGNEDSLEALIFTKLWNKNQETKTLTKEQRNKAKRVLQSNESMRIDAISQAKSIRYKFINYLFNMTNPIVFEMAREHAEKAGFVELTPAEQQKKRRAQQKAEAEKVFGGEDTPVTETPKPTKREPVTENAPVAQTPVEPVVPKPTTATPATPATPTYKDSPAQREKDRNKDALAAAVAKAEKEGKSTPVTGIRALAAAIGVQPSQPKPSAPKQTPQQLGYKVSPDNLTATHPSGRFSVVKEGGMYSVKEGNTNRAVFKSFADAHKFIEEKVKAQTPPPAPVGRPATPKTPEPVKKAIEEKEKQQIETNTAKPPAEVGKAQAVVVNQGLAALDPINSNAVAQVLQIEDNLTLKTDQLTNKTATTADKRYTATRTRTGIRVVMNAHIDPVTKQQVKGKKIGDVQTAEQAQLLIREFDFKQRRLLEQQGVDVAGQLQAQNPVLTPAQVQQVTQTAVAQAQSQPPVPPVATPQTKAETHPMFTTAIAALSTMGVSKTDAKDRVKKAIEEIGFNADLQAILKHAFTQGAPAAQRIANSNATHAATVQATGNAPVTPQAAATVVIMPTVAGTQSATGGSVPPAPNIGVPPVIKTPPATAPALSAERLSYVDTACRFIPRKSMYILSSGVQAEGVTYTNALGYMIVQSGISKWRAFNPAAALISVTDNEQEAVDAILREVFKR